MSIQSLSQKIEVRPSYEKKKLDYDWEITFNINKKKSKDFCL